MMLPIWIGFFAGIIHVLSGPDHIATLVPLAVGKKKNEWLAGLNWGIGHTSGVWLVGIVALLVREILPVEALSSFSERLVGVALIGVGLWGIGKVIEHRLHCHQHTDEVVIHSLTHVQQENYSKKHDAKHTHTDAALIVGTLHGLAGSSHFLGVLPALALPSQAASLSYMLFFGFGSIAAMTAFAWSVGFFSKKYSKRNAHFPDLLLGGSSTVAVGLGVVWIFF